MWPRAKTAEYKKDGHAIPACAALLRIFRSSCVAYTGFRPPLRFCTGCTAFAAVCSAAVASGDDAGEDVDRGGDVLTAAMGDDVCEFGRFTGSSGVGSVGQAWGAGFESEESRKCWVRMREGWRTKDCWLAARYWVGRY